MVIKLLRVNEEEDHRHISCQVVENMDEDGELGGEEKGLDVPPEEDLVGGDHFGDPTRPITLQLQAILQDHLFLIFIKILQICH